MFFRLDELAERELSKTPNNTRPEPLDVGIQPDEIDFMYQVWTFWRATDKRHLLGALIEDLEKHERVYGGVLELENLYAITREIKNPTKPDVKHGS